MVPCYCGDPYCPSCFPGNNGCIEAAEEQLLKELGTLGLSPKEYALISKLASVIIPHVRETAQSIIDELQSMNAYAKQLAEEAILARQLEKR